MNYEAPKVVASFAADAVLTEAAASGAHPVSFARTNDTAVIAGTAGGVTALGAELMSR